MEDIRRITVANGAVPGTLSQYMSACHNVHIPSTADIIFLEYAINDEEMPMPHFNNRVRRPFEKLIRKVLNYPNRPAVIIYSGFRWFNIPPHGQGEFWASAERQHMEFAWYYSLPALSVKAGCYPLMRQGVPGFQVKRPRADMHGRVQHGTVDGGLKRFAFYYDVIHPDGNTGHRIMAEIAAQAILDAYAQVAAGPVPPSMLVPVPMLSPMLPANWESRTDKCFIATGLKNVVDKHEGWEWRNDGKNALLPKWGYTSEVPGTVLTMKVNTTTQDAHNKEKMVTVEVAFLKSYENMGRARLTCAGDCHCPEKLLDGHHTHRASQSYLEPVRVSQAESCLLVVTVLNETSSGKHRFKVSGVMLSEEPDDEPFANWAALDMVASAAMRDGSGVYDVKNVARRRLHSLYDWSHNKRAAWAWQGVGDAEEEEEEEAAAEAVGGSGSLARRRRQLQGQGQGQGRRVSAEELHRAHFGLGA